MNCVTVKFVTRFLAEEYKGSQLREFQHHHKVLRLLVVLKIEKLS